MTKKSKTSSTPKFKKGDKVIVNGNWHYSYNELVTIDSYYFSDSGYHCYITEEQSSEPVTEHNLRLFTKLELALK